MIDDLVQHDCADCLSDTQIVHLADNVHIVQILHDDTCPALNEEHTEPTC